MKKLYLQKVQNGIMLMLFMVCAMFGFSQGNENFGTVTPNNTSYGVKTTSTGWSFTNAAVIASNNTYAIESCEGNAVVINGKTTAVGTITSPVLTGGCGNLSFHYGNCFSESNGISFQLQIKNAGAQVVFDTTVTVAQANVLQGETLDFNADVHVAGDFQIVITNLSPSHSTSNKDRVAFSCFEWTAQEGTPAVVVSAPEFNPAAGSYLTAQEIVLTASNDAIIHYTLDGTEPDVTSPIYSEPFSISENTTVKAIAISGDVSSIVVTANYVFPISVANIAAFKAANTATNTNLYKITNDLTFVYRNGNNIYLQDESAGLLVYDTRNYLPSTYEEGDVISGGLIGSYTLYNGMVELIPVTNTAEASGNVGAIVPVEVTAANLIENYATYESRLVKVADVTFNSDYTFSNSARSTTFTQDETTMTLYNSFKTLTASVTSGEQADVIGFLASYGENKQLYCRDNYDIIPTIVTLPYEEDFEGRTNSWTVLNETQNNKWFKGQVGDFDNSKMYISSNDGASNKYNNNATSCVLAYVDVMVPTIGAMMSFDYRVAGENNYDYLQVSVLDADAELTAGTQPSTYAARYALHNSWTNATVAIDGAEDEPVVKRVVFTWRNDGSAGQQPAAAFDNVIIIAGQCAQVVNVTVSEITDNSANVAWTDATNTAWTVEYRAAGAANWTVVNTTETNVDLTQLNASTEYEVRVKALCEANTSSVYQTATFTTLSSCEQPTDVMVANQVNNAIISWNGTAASYVVEFKQADATEWLSITTTENQINLTGIVANTAYDVRVKAICGENDESAWTAAEFISGCDVIEIPYLQTFNTTATPSCWISNGWNFNGSVASANVTEDAAYLITPAVAVPTDATVTMNFDANGSADYKVMLSLRSTDARYFVHELEVVNNSVVIPVNYAGQTVYMAFVNENGSMTVDNVEITACASTPTNLTVSNIQYNQAELSWDNAGTPSEYEVVYTTNGVSNTIIVPTNSFVLTGLTAETEYTVNVISHCGTYVSNVSNTATFTTIEQCVTPSNLTVVLVDDAVVLTWNAHESQNAWGVQYRIAGTDVWSAVVNATESSYTINGLQGSTNYEFRVQALCEDNFTSNYAETSYYIPCVQSGTTATFNEMTSVGNNNTAPFNNYYKNSWTQMVYTPDQVGSTGVISTIAFNASTAINFNCSTLKIYMGTKSDLNNTTSDWVPASNLTLVYEANNTNIGTLVGWETFNLQTPFSYAGDENLVVVVARQSSSYNSSLTYAYENVPNAILYRRNDSNANYAEHPGANTGTISYYLPVAQFNITPCSDPVLCAVPTNVTVSNIGLTTAQVSWDGTADSYIVKYTDNEGNVNILENVTGNTCTLTNLTSNQADYSVQVAAVCFENNMSVYSAVATFITLCDFMVLPYVENFDSITGTTSTSETVLPTCWNQINNGTSYTGLPTVYQSSTYASSAPNTLRFYTGTYSSYGVQYAVLPPVNTAENAMTSIQLDLSAAAYSSSSSYGCTFEIGVMTNPMDYSTFVTVETIHPTSTSYTDYTIYFSEYAGNGNYIAIRCPKEGGGNSSYNVGYIDNIAVSVAPTCSAPVVAAYDQLTKTLSWTNGTQGTPESYVVECWAEDNTVVTFLSTTNSVVLSGLNVETEYTCHVKVICGAEDESAWSEIFTFTTPEGGCVAPMNVVAMGQDNGVINVTWNADPEQTAWAVQYRRADVPVWSAEAIVNTTSYTITGLEGYQNYIVRVKALCGNMGSDYAYSNTTATPCINGSVANVTIGTGTSTSYYSPFNAYYKNSWNQTIYTPEEVGSAGDILSLAYDYNSTATLATTSLQIYMGHKSGGSTHASNSDWVPMSDLTLVYSSTSENLGGASGWKTYTFDEAFHYNGTDNLVVVVAKRSSSYNSSVQCRYTNVTNANMYRQSDGSSDYSEHPGSNTGTRGFYKPNIKFVVENCSDALACTAEIENIAVSNVTSNSAVATWNTADGVDAYVVEYREVDANEGVVVNTTFNTVTMTGLNENTDYVVSVNPLCGTNYGAAATSEFTTPYSAMSGNDIAVTSIDMADDCDLSNITFTVGNYGAHELTSMTATYIVNGGAPVSEVFNFNLPIGRTITHTFATPATFEQGANTVNVTVAVEGEAAAQTADNTMTRNDVVLVTPLTAPYAVLPQSNAQANVGGWMVYDVNNDTTKWSLSSGVANYSYNDYHAANDWVITPCYDLPAGTYKVSYEYKVSSRFFPEAFNVYMGQGSQVADMNQLVGQHIITNEAYETATQYVTIAQDGIYHIGIQAVSPAGELGMSIRNITVVPMVYLTVSTNGHGTITPSGTVLATANTVKTFVLAPEVGYQLQNVTVNGEEVMGLDMSMASTIIYNHNVTDHADVIVANFQKGVTIHYNLISGNGTINEMFYSAPVSFNEYISVGGSLLSTFAPAPGYNIANININGVDYNNINAWNFQNVTEDQEVTITFGLNEYTINTMAYGNGTVSDGVTFTYDPAYTYTFEAQPGENAHIVSILRNNEELVVADPSYYTETLTNIVDNYNYVARFASNYFTVNATAGAHGMITPVGATTYHWGVDVSYAISADYGYYIASVTVDGETTNYTQADAMNETVITFNDILADHDIAVTFAQYQYTITVNAGANGAIAPATSTYAAGTTPAFSITPDAGYGIADVTVDGVSVGTPAIYTFTALNADHIIEATFAQYAYTINAIAGNGGTITPAGVTNMFYNGNQTYTITPETGYHIVGVYVDGIAQGAVDTYSFTNVQANHTIYAAFAANEYTITVNQPVNGVITPGTTTVLYGATPTFTITPATGYNVTAITLNGTNVIANATQVNGIYTYTLPAVAANQTLTATMTMKTFTINATAGANGTVTPAGNTTVNYGATCTYTITPANGYVIDNVTVDGMTMGAVASYTFVNVVANHTINATFRLDVCEVPANLQTINIDTTTATLSWYHAGAQSYDIQYKAIDAPTFTSISNVPGFTYNLTNLQPNTAYVWYVRANCLANNASEWTNGCVFRTLENTNSIGVEGYASALVKVYANSNNVYIVNENGVQIDNVMIYDIYGKLLYNGQANSTSEVISMNVATGTYMVRLATDKGMLNYKIHLTR